MKPGCFYTDAPLTKAQHKAVLVNIALAKQRLVDVQAQNETLKLELVAAKLALRKVREERCLDALQRVLEDHRCQLLALPNGQFQVSILEE